MNQSDEKQPTSQPSATVVQMPKKRAVPKNPWGPAGKPGRAIPEPKLLGACEVDHRSTAYRAALRWRRLILKQLPEASVHQRALVDSAVISKITLDQLNAWLVANAAKPAKIDQLLRVLRERERLTMGLNRIFDRLGLTKARGTKPVSRDDGSAALEALRNEYQQAPKARASTAKKVLA